MTTSPLSLLGYQWLPRTSFSGKTPHCHSIESYIEHLKHTRGINLEIGDLLVPSEATLQMHEAAKRISAAIKNGERIGLAGDYDCDGITGVAQLLRFFRRSGVEPAVHLPHRVQDGYGIKPSTVASLGKLDLLITVDTGVVAHEAVTFARKQGTDVIVIDHHHLPQDLPQATIILHPSLLHLPLPHPCASGLVHMFLRAMAKDNNGGQWDGWAEDCALAAIGTIADLVPLQGNNRILAQEGIAALNSLRTGPLATLRERIQRGKIRSSDVAFRLAPRLNAAGRMADPHIALEAILHGGEALDTLEELNSERQQSTERTLAHALLSLPKPLSPAIVLMHETYHPGIIGLIAGKLTDRTGRPSLVASVSGESCTASLRSTDTYNLVEGLSRCSHLLKNFGGHAQAAGCTFDLKNAEELHKALCADVDAQTKHVACLPLKMFDAFLPPQMMNTSLCSAIETLEPFGQGNPEPRFVLSGVTIASMRRIGANGAHLQGNIQGIPVIGFGLGLHKNTIPSTCDTLCRIGINQWNGIERVQIFLEDICEAQPKAVCRI